MRTTTRIMPPKQKKQTKKTSKAAQSQGKKMEVRRQQVGVSKGLTAVTRVPVIRRQGASVRVSHREFIGDVVGSVGFVAQGYSINPGVAATFPWLSTVANNFEKYRFRKLKFCFESSVATTVSGMSMMAIDLDASDTQPGTKVQLMSYQGASRANVWEEHSTTMPENQPELYVRRTVVSGTDIKTYDAGTLWFATTGEPDSTVIGELYAEYEVELHVPQLTGGTAQALTLSGSTQDFSQDTVTGSIPIYRTINQIALPGYVGARYQITAYIGTGAAVALDLSTPAVSGSVGSITERIAGVLPAEQMTTALVTCVSVTNTSYPAGPGWFVVGIVVPPSQGHSIFINQSEQGVVFPPTAIQASDKDRIIELESVVADLSRNVIKDAKADSKIKERHRRFLDFHWVNGNVGGDANAAGGAAAVDVGHKIGKRDLSRVELSDKIHTINANNKYVRCPKARCDLEGTDPGCGIGSSYVMDLSTVHVTGNEDRTDGSILSALPNVTLQVDHSCNCVCCLTRQSSISTNDDMYETLLEELACERSFVDTVSEDDCP